MIELIIKDNILRINEGIINRDINQLEKEGKVSGYKDGVFTASYPDIYGLLKCLRDNREYNAEDIENFCMEVCPHYNCSSKDGDDAIFLCDCKKHLFEGLSLDGKTKYVEFLPLEQKF